MDDSKKDFEQILREDIARHNSDIDKRMSISTGAHSQTPPPPKRNLKPVIITGISAAVIVLLCGFIFRGDLLRFFSPKHYIAYAAYKTQKDSDYGFEKSITGLLKLLQNNSHQKSTRLAVSSLDFNLPYNLKLPFNTDSISGFEISLSTFVDRSALHALNTMELKHSGESLLTADFYVANDKIGLRIPMLYDIYFIANPNNLATNWNNAPVGSMLAYPLDSNINTNIPYDTLYDNVFSSSQGDIVLNQLIETFKRYLEQDAFGFTNHGKTGVTVNKSLKSLSHLSISISQDKFDNLYTDLMDIITRNTSIADSLRKEGFSTSSSTDVVLNLYTNSENKIEKLDVKLELTNADKDTVIIESEIELAGDTSVFDLINLYLKVSADDNNAIINASLNQADSKPGLLRSFITASVTNSGGYYYDAGAEISVGLNHGRNPAYLSASIEGYDDFKATVLADGNINFDVSGARIDAEFDTVSVYASNSSTNATLDFSVDASIGSLISEIKPPAADSVDFLSIKQMDIYNILLRSISSIYKILQPFGVTVL